jgi:2-succinyl-5-enolpyruvyl-6-hydroxy-3-cyclohexene-1-carboxylate synthase
MIELVDHLKKLGVSQIFFGAGARNSELVSVLNGFKHNFILDERSGAFSALGLSKASNAPVVICTTSGTAVAECLPAVIEAYYSRVKLIILSADRPARLHGTHAPQTIEQSNIFSSYVNSQYSGTLKDYKKKNICYPFQINLEIDDNKYDNKEESTCLSLESVKEKLDMKKYPLVVLTEGGQFSKEQLRILTQANFLFYIECTSEHKTNDLKIQSLQEKTVLRLLERKEIDLIIKDGMTPFSKIWRELDRKYINVEVLSYQNSKHGLGRGFSFDELPTELHIKNKKDPLETNMGMLLKEFPLSEVATYNTIKEDIQKSDIVYVGNSMAIRYWQLVDDTENKIFASRGANGIDGQLSTAIGIAMSSNVQVHCIVGDLTFLYDIGSLVSQIPSNLKIHVVNNFGGRIFERINVSPGMKLEHKQKIKNIISGFKNSHLVHEYFPDNEETQKFWEKFNGE